MADAPGPDADLVLKGLDAEISRITHERTSPGWTNWAVSATVGAVLWALAGLSSVHFSRSTGQLILALSLAIDLLHALRVYVSPQRNDIVFGFRSTRTLAGQRPLFILGFARACVLTWALVHLGGGWWTLYAAPGIWAYAGSILKFVVLFVATFKDLPHPLAPGPRHGNFWAKAVPVSMSVGGVLATFYVGSATYRDWKAGLLTADDLRFAGGVVAIIYLLGKLASDAPDPSIEALVKTRRDLAFGRIDPASAVKQADIAIAGVKFSEFLKDDVANYISLLQAAHGEVTQIHAKADSLMRALPVRPYSDAQLALIRTVADSCRAHLSRAKDSMLAMKKSRVHRKKAAVALDDDMRETFDKLRSEGEAFERQLDVAAGRLENEVLPLLEDTGA